MRILALVALFASAPGALAGIFSPNEPCPFEVSPEGVAKPLPLNVFKLFLNDRVAALQPAGPSVQPGSTVGTPTFKGAAENRLKYDKPAPSRAEMVGLSADLLRLGHARAVVELLKPTLRDRNLDYRLLAHLALAHAALGDWETALLRQANAVGDSDPPTELAGTKPEQLKWMLKVDKTYTRRWLRAAQTDANPRTKPTDPDVPPLFRLDDGTPLTFHEPLSAAERQALPIDAVAIVQQMVLWAPLDANLLWLLGAVHLANGQFAEAFDILEQGREPRKLTWPKFRAMHAGAEGAYAELPKTTLDDTPLGPPIPEPDPDPDPPPPRGLFAVVAPAQFALVAGLFALAVLALVALQIRKLRRKRRLR